MIILMKVLGFITGALIDPISIGLAAFTAYKIRTQDLSFLSCAAMMTLVLDIIIGAYNPEYRFGQMLFVRHIVTLTHVFLFIQFFKIINIGKKINEDQHTEVRNSNHVYDADKYSGKLDEIQEGRRLAKQDLGDKLDQMVLFRPSSEMSELYLKYAKENKAKLERKQTKQNATREKINIVSTPKNISTPTRIIKSKTPDVNIGLRSQKWKKMIEKAIKDGNSLDIEYVNANGNPSRRTITPHSIFRIRKKLNVRAYCSLRKESRSFALRRIENMTMNGNEDISTPSKEETLITALTKSDLGFIDNRDKGGALWVRVNKSKAKKAKLLKICHKFKVKANFAKNGGRATSFQPAYFISA